MTTVSSNWPLNLEIDSALHAMKRDACTPLVSLAQTTPQLETLRWHYCLGHPNFQVLKNHANVPRMVEGLHCQITPLELLGKSIQT